MRQAVAVLGILATTVIWGSTFILIRWTVAELDVAYFLFLRFSIAALVLLLLFPRRFRRLKRETIHAGIGLGVLLAAAFLAQTLGLRYTTASNSALITCLYMVLVPFFVLAYREEHPPWFSLLGIAIALPGAYLLTQYSFAGINRGDLITAFVPIVAAWHIVLTGRWGRRHPLVPLVALQFLTVAVICGAATIVTGGATLAIAPIGWATIIVTALFASCLAFIAMTAAQRVIDPTRAGVLFAMEAVFGALFGWWLGGETMTTLSFIGACLMVAGMVLSEVHALARGLIAKVVG